MVLDKYELRYREYLKAEKELNEIYRQDRARPWVPLTKPYQDGWWLNLELRPEVKRRQDAANLQLVMDLCMEKVRCKNPKLVAAIRKCKRVDQARALFPHTAIFLPHYFSNDHPHMKHIHEDIYKTLKPDVQRWFHLDRWESAKLYHRGKNMYYPNIPEHFMKMKPRPAMVTHIREMDPQMQRREAELEKITKAYWWHKSFHDGDYGRNYRHGPRRAFQRVELRKILKGEKEDYEQLKTIRDYD